MEEINLQEWHKMEEMAEHTANYMAEGEGEMKRDRCVDDLLKVATLEWRSSFANSEDTGVSKSSFIIGIEFGDPFTGVAYYHAQSGNGSPKDVADEVSVIKSWPSSSLHYTEKTPTIIAYNTVPPTWGGSVKPQDDPQVSHFILGLQPDDVSHYSDPLSQPPWKGSR